MEDIKLLRLRLLELADKRTDEHDSVHKMVDNAKVLLNFVDSSADEVKVHYEGVGYGENSNRNDKTELPQIGINDSEQVKKTASDEFDVELVTRTWLTLCFLPWLAHSIEGASSEYPLEYSIDAVFKSVEKNIPKEIKSDELVAFVKRIVFEHLHLAKKKSADQYKILATDEFKQRMDDFSRIEEETKRLRPINTETLSDELMGDVYIKNYISRQNNEQVPFALEQNIREAVKELKDVQFQNLMESVKKIMSDERLRREEESKQVELKKKADELIKSKVANDGEEDQNILDCKGGKDDETFPSILGPYSEAETYIRGCMEEYWDK